MVCLFFTLLAPAASAQQVRENSCKVLVVGFVGGLGAAHFPPTVATPLLHHLRSLGYPGVCIKSIPSYCPWCAAHWVKKQFAEGEKGRLTPEQIERGPKVITFGYSLGVPNELHFARVLEREGIPIELLVAVDSRGFTKGIIPRNVKDAANFYERQFYPFYTGKSNLRPEDPEATNFLGNIHVEHAGHFKIVRTAAVRDLLDDAVRGVFASNENTAPAASDP
ncbi:MAG: hypothetical protein WBC04_09490 [Candidatus Acidiferrales bacterium]